MDWREEFKAGLSYQDFLSAYGTPEHRDRWQAVYEQVTLRDRQLSLLSGFIRQMNVLCLAGAWCGDCAEQCPIFQRFAEAGGKIDLRFLDRDAQPNVQETLSINGGHRVPTVLFLSEDYCECARYGERTLSKYREMAATQLGAASPTGTVQPGRSLLDTVTAEWLAEFERIQLMLRLSPRLRAKHGD